MSDPIERQAAIKALGERPMVWVNSDYELGARNQYDADVLALETLPTAQPGWIPCTPDTMPQEDGEYLVTIHWESGGYYTDLLAYKAYWKEWKDEDRIFGTVIAWQPKPKPWEGDANG